MHKTLGCTLILITLAVNSCSSVNISSDWDRDVDFESYKTYAWIDQVRKKHKPKRHKSLLHKRIKKAANEKLAEQGFTLVQHKKPDLVIAYHTAVQKRVDVTMVDYGPWRPHWGRQKTISKRHYKEGTLIIDIIDPHLKQVIWRGSATGVIGRLDEMGEKVRESVFSILERFPPGE